ncbi:MAG: hypothetical protein M1819_000814 [Sarea resinae]|nr:MAG: hypothetical protein M1819_000814 [Sarea resinae]
MPSPTAQALNVYQGNYQCKHSIYGRLSWLTRDIFGSRSRFYHYLAGHLNWAIIEKSDQDCDISVNRVAFEKLKERTNDQTKYTRYPFNQLMPDPGCQSQALQVYIRLVFTLASRHISNWYAQIKGSSLVADLLQLLTPDGTHAGEVIALFSRDYFGDALKETVDLRLQGRTAYRILEILFLPGTVIIPKDPKLEEKDQADEKGYAGSSRYCMPECLMVEKVMPMSDSLRLECRQYKWTNGIVAIRKFITIHPFDGSKSIRSLDYYPLEFCHDADNVRRTLYERAKTYKTLTKEKLWQYEGNATTRGGEVRYVRGRIVVDPSVAYGPLPLRVSRYLQEVPAPIVRGEDQLLYVGQVKVYLVEESEWIEVPVTEKGLSCVSWAHDPIGGLRLKDSTKEALKKAPENPWLIFLSGATKADALQREIAKSYAENHHKLLYTAKTEHLSLHSMTAEEALGWLEREASCAISWNAILCIRNGDDLFNQYSSTFAEFLHKSEVTIVVYFSRVPQVDTRDKTFITLSLIE